MPRRPFLPSRLAAALATALAPAAASAVSLAADGLGQALIYPYYTVRSSAEGNAYNTYLSVVNTTSDAKALRVRVREGRAGREVLSLNLYLSPNDVWTAALVPTGDGTRLLSVDTSCTDPAISAQFGLPLHANAYTGANADGFGDTLDRTREGYIEMIEMATLTGESRANVIHTNAGTVPGCAAMRASASPSVVAPSGGLSGTLTLINVNNGQDFALDATALDQLATRPFFRAPGDPYPDFNAAEIDPVSAVVENGQLYRASWSRPVDAVTAVLMRTDWLSEFVGDTATASQTDLVMTLPTRHHYVTADEFTPPFRANGRWAAGCGEGELLRVVWSNREGRAAEGGNVPILCAAAAVTSVDDIAHLAPPNEEQTRVLASRTRGLANGLVRVTRGFESGRLWLIHPGAALASSAQSTRIDLASGASAIGAQVYAGLPAIGFFVRTFRNGTLACTGAATCQGNYGGAFAFKYRRSISPP